MSGPATGLVTDPFGPPAPRGCRVEDGRLHLDGLVTADPDAVAGARRAAGEGGQRALDAWCSAVVSVGARAVSAAGGSAGTDALAARVDAMAATVDGTADRAVEVVAAAVERAADPDSGTIAVALGRSFKRLVTDLDTLLAGEDAPVRVAVARAVRLATSEAADRIDRALADSTAAVRAVMSPSDPAGPWALLRAEFLRVTDGLARDLGGQLAAVREGQAAAAAAGGALRRSAVKGQGWEETVVAAVTDVAGAAGPGDTVEATGTAAGATGGRRGDAVLTVGRASAHGLDVRVAVEAKDSRLSSAAWARELEEAARNRGAAGAVGVVRGVDAMPGRSPVLVLSPTRMVVAWDPVADDGSLLRAVLLLVRAASLDAVTAASVPDLDREALAAAVRGALEELARFDELQRAAAAARRALDQLTASADRLRADLTRRLSAGARLLAPTEA